MSNRPHVFCLEKYRVFGIDLLQVFVTVSAITTAEAYFNIYGPLALCNNTPFT